MRKAWLLNVHQFVQAVQFLLVSMGGRAEGLGCADPGARLNNLKQCNLKLYLGFLLGKELENLICFIK
jgi:hypothetical protein